MLPESAGSYLMAYLPVIRLDAFSGRSPDWFLVHVTTADPGFAPKFVNELVDSTVLRSGTQKRGATEAGRDRDDRPKEGLCSKGGREARTARTGP